MNAMQDAQSVMGALRFVADLSAAAAECRVARTRDDELTARRLRREADGPDDLPRDERGVKAL
jgi:hypothetical protein